MSSFDRLQNARRIFEELKSRTRNMADRVEIEKGLAELREFENLSPPSDFDQWCRLHAADWNPSAKDIAVIRFILACGRAHRDEIARIIGTPDNPASNESVRRYMSDLRRRFFKAKATATIPIAGRSGEYHTHDPVIQSQPPQPVNNPGGVFRVQNGGEVLRFPHR